MCKEPGGLPKGFSVVDLRNWRQGILWFSMVLGLASSHFKLSQWLRDLQQAGWRRLAKVGEQHSCHHENGQAAGNVPSRGGTGRNMQHFREPRSTEFGYSVPAVPSYLGILQNWRPWRKHRLRPKILRQTSSQLDWLETLKARARFPPKGVMKLVSEKHNLNPTNIQQISNTISTISNNKTTSRVRLKDLSWSPSRFGRLPFQRRHAGRSANPAATTAKTLGIDWCQCGFVLHFDMSNCVNQHCEFFWIILVSPITWERMCMIAWLQRVVHGELQNFLLESIGLENAGQCGVCSLFETPKPQLSTLAGWCIWLTPSARVHKPVAEACPKNAWGCGLLREQRNQ